MLHGICSQKKQKVKLHSSGFNISPVVFCICHFCSFQTNQGYTIYSQPLLWFSLSSAVLHLGYFIVLQKGYRSADLSVVYPLARGSAPLVSFIAAIVFLHEQLKLSSAIGLLLIIAGVLIITGLSFKKENNSKIMTGITYGMLTGLFIALYTFNDAVAVKTYGYTSLGTHIGYKPF